MRRRRQPGLGIRAAAAALGLAAPSWAADADGPGADGLWSSAAAVDGTLILLPDLDDDDRDGRPDWDVPQWRPDGELAWLKVRGASGCLLTASGVALRVWADGRPLLETGDGVDRDEARLDGDELDLALQLGGWGRGELAMNCGDRVTTWPLRSAPVRFPSSLAPIERAFVVAVDRAAAPIAGLRAVLGDRLRVLDAADWSDDRWLQDAFELGRAVGPTGQLRVVLEAPGDSVRGDRGSFVLDMLGVEPDTVVVRFPDVVPTRFDGLGNLEPTPPLWWAPDGALLLGRGGPEGPARALVEFLQTATRQPVVTVPMGWSCVGHVDEAVAFLPDPSAPRGFRVLLPSVALGLELLATLDPKTPLPQWEVEAWRRGWHTAGQLQSDLRTIAWNRALDEGALASTRDALRVALELLPEETTLVPALFVPQEDEVGRRCAVPLLPAATNVLVVPEADRATVVLQDPRLRAPGVPLSRDPVVAWLRRNLPTAVRLHFVDAWEAWHALEGEVHCATNVERAR